MDDRRELEAIAMVVHGALALGHLLGIIYNVRRGNYKVAVVHAVALVFDLGAVFFHMRDLKEKK